MHLQAGALQKLIEAKRDEVVQLAPRHDGLEGQQTDWGMTRGLIQIEKLLPDYQKVLCSDKIYVSRNGKKKVVQVDKVW